MKERDYDEALKAKFDIEIQSEAFGFNRTLFTEGITYEYHDKHHNDVRNEGNMKMNSHSHFSDDSDNNEATTFEHVKISFTGCMIILFYKGLV